MLILSGSVLCWGLLGWSCI